MLAPVAVAHGKGKETGLKGNHKLVGLVYNFEAEPQAFRRLRGQ